MNKLTLITPWAGDGSEENPNHPEVADNYVFNMWSDITGTASADILNPTTHLIIEFICNYSVMTAIEADMVQ